MMRLTYTLKLAGTVFCAWAGIGAGVSPTWSGYVQETSPSVFKVVQYVDLEGEGKMVVLQGGGDAGLVPGQTLKVYRLHRSLDSKTEEPMAVPVGTVKTIETQSGYATATVLEQELPLARSLFPKFPGIMAGDLAVVKTVNVTKRQAVVPTIALAYHDLFEDPKASPSTFELSPLAAAKLREAASAFANARMSLLMVEGHTDHHGNAGDNQVESYQRAMTIRQYLIDQLGFAEDRVVAVGYGESELTDETMTPGYTRVNRRIVLKAVPVNQESAAVH